MGRRCPWVVHESVSEENSDSQVSRSSSPVELASGSDQSEFSSDASGSNTHIEMPRKDVPRISSLGLEASSSSLPPTFISFEDGDLKGLAAETPDRPPVNPLAPPYPSTNPVNLLPASSPPTKIHQEYIDEIRSRYLLPSNEHIYIPSAKQRPDTHIPGWSCVYLVSLEAGLRFPLPRQIVRFVRWFDVALSQLAPNVIRNILTILYCSGTLNLPVSHKSLLHHYTLRQSHNKEPNRLSMYPNRHSRSFICNPKESDKNYKKKYFFVRTSEMYHKPSLIRERWREFKSSEEGSPILSKRERVLAENWGSAILALEEEKRKPENVLTATNLALTSYWKKAAIKFAMKAKLGGTRFRDDEELPPPAVEALSKSVAEYVEHPGIPKIRPPKSVKDPKGKTVAQASGKGSKASVRPSSTSTEGASKRAQGSTDAEERSPKRPKIKITQKDKDKDKATEGGRPEGGQPQGDYLGTSTEVSTFNFMMSPRPVLGGVGMSQPLPPFPLPATPDEDGFIHLKFPNSGGFFSQPDVMLTELARLRTQSDAEHFKNLGNNFMQTGALFSNLSSAMWIEADRQYRELQEKAQSWILEQKNLEAKVSQMKGVYNQEVKEKKEAQARVAALSSELEANNATLKIADESITEYKAQLDAARAEIDARKVEEDKLRAQIRVERRAREVADAKGKEIVEHQKERLKKYRVKLGEERAEAQLYAKYRYYKATLKCYNQVRNSETESWTPEEGQRMEAFVKLYDTNSCEVEFEAGTDSEPEEGVEGSDPVDDHSDHNEERANPDDAI